MCVPPFWFFSENPMEKIIRKKNSQRKHLMNVKYYQLTLVNTCLKMSLNGKLYNFHFHLFFFFGFLFSYTSLEKSITINVAPKSEECFYESVKPGQIIDIDYQVIDGGQGSFEISFYLMSPSDREIVMDFKKSEKAHRIEAGEEGDFKFCFDNRFSSFNKKTVYFELIIENEDGNDADMWDIFAANLSPEDQYEIAIKDIEESVKRVKSHLLKIRHLQEAVRAFATKDKNVLEGNFLKVNCWSLIQMIVMITVGLVQVVMVKSLFDEQSKMHKIWKRNLS